MYYYYYYILLLIRNLHRVSIIRTLRALVGTEDAGEMRMSVIVARNPKFTPGFPLSELYGLQQGQKTLGGGIRQV